jgi:dihydroorotase
MPLEKLDNCELPATADFHVHLRSGSLMELVVPTIRSGGVNTVYVMVSPYLSKFVRFKFDMCSQISYRRLPPYTQL